MIKRIRAKNREKEILHNYLEFLAENYENIEPTEMADSISKVYDTLNSARDFVKSGWFTVCACVFSNFILGFLVFVVYLFWR